MESPRRVSSDSISIRRVPVNGRDPSEQQKSDDTPRLMITSSSSSRLSNTTRFDASFNDVDTSYRGLNRMSKQSSWSLRSYDTPSIDQEPGRGLLPKSPTTSIREQFDEFAPRHVCTSSTHFKKGINNWLARSMIFLSAFSTCFSGAFLCIALSNPRYSSKTIGPNGALTISSAAFLTSFFAKLIELSFATVLVAFLGQALAKRLYRTDDNKGITLARDADAELDNRARHDVYPMANGQIRRCFIPRYSGIDLCYCGNAIHICCNSSCPASTQDLPMGRQSVAVDGSDVFRQSRLLAREV